MHKLLVKLSCLCIEKRIITQAQAEWFVYGVEKRLSTILAAIPCFYVAILLSDLTCATFFFATYFYIRRFSGGYHAKTVCGCIFFSLATEIVVLGIVCSIGSHLFFLLCILPCMLIIHLLSPCNHPNLHLTEVEVSACKKHTRIRILMVALAFFVSYVSGVRTILQGITAGCILASMTLLLGQINYWRLQHENFN